MPTSPSEVLRRLHSVPRALARIAFLSLGLGVAASGCGRSFSSNGMGSACQCADGTACPLDNADGCCAPGEISCGGVCEVSVTGECATQPGSGTGDGGSGITNGEDAAAAVDASRLVIPPTGPYCIAFDNLDVFYGKPIPQCGCQDSWVLPSDVQWYIAVLIYYPGLYANPQFVTACPHTYACCVRQVKDNGRVRPGCWCSDALVDCLDDTYFGATPTESCP